MKLDENNAYKLLSKEISGKITSKIKEGSGLNELARKCALSASLVVKLRDGKGSTPELGTLVKLAKGLQLPDNHFIDAFQFYLGLTDINPNMNLWLLNILDKNRYAENDIKLIFEEIFETKDIEVLCDKIFECLIDDEQKIDRKTLASYLNDDYSNIGHLQMYQISQTLNSVAKSKHFDFKLLGHHVKNKMNKMVMLNKNNELKFTRPEFIKNQEMEKLFDNYNSLSDDKRKQLVDFSNYLTIQK